MKKSVLILLCLVVTTSLIFAQNLQIFHNGILLTPNEVINLTGGSSELMLLPLDIKNTSNSTMDVKIKKIQHSLLTDSENSFCFAGSCYSPSTLISLSAAAIFVNGVDTSFEADYNAYGGSGVSTITYVFFNTANVNDSVSVVVNYSTSLGINDFAKSDVHFSDAFPNPASNNVSFTYALPKQIATAKIAIRNLLGSMVTEVELNEQNGKKTINTGNLKDGIYFYSLIVNDKVFYTRKLIVKH